MADFLPRLAESLLRISKSEDKGVSLQHVEALLLGIVRDGFSGTRSLPHEWSAVQAMSKAMPLALSKDVQAAVDEGLSVDDDDFHSIPPGSERCRADPDNLLVRWVHLAVESGSMSSFLCGVSSQFQVAAAWRPTAAIRNKISMQTAADMLAASQDSLSSAFSDVKTGQQTKTEPHAVTSAASTGPDQHQYISSKSQKYNTPGQYVSSASPQPSDATLHTSCAVEDTCHTHHTPASKTSEAFEPNDLDTITKYCSAPQQSDVADKDLPDVQMTVSNAHEPQAVVDSSTAVKDADQNVDIQGAGFHIETEEDAISRRQAAAIHKQASIVQQRLATASQSVHTFMSGAVHSMQRRSTNQVSVVGNPTSASVSAVASSTTGGSGIEDNSNTSLQQQAPKPAVSSTTARQLLSTGVTMSWAGAQKTYEYTRQGAALLAARLRAPAKPTSHVDVTLTVLPSGADADYIQVLLKASDAATASFDIKATTKDISAEQRSDAPAAAAVSGATAAACDVSTTAAAVANEATAAQQSKLQVRGSWVNSLSLGWTGRRSVKEAHAAQPEVSASTERTNSIESAQPGNPKDVSEDLARNESVPAPSSSAASSSSWKVHAAAMLGSTWRAVGTATAATATAVSATTATAVARSAQALSSRHKPDQQQQGSGHHISQSSGAQQQVQRSQQTRLDNGDPNDNIQPQAAGSESDVDCDLLDDIMDVLRGSSSVTMQQHTTNSNRTNTIGYTRTSAVNPDRSSQGMIESKASNGTVPSNAATMSAPAGRWVVAGESETPTTQQLSSPCHLSFVIVEGHITRQDQYGEPYTVYKFVCGDTTGKTWAVLRRFSDFVTLKKALVNLQQQQQHSTTQVNRRSSSSSSSQMISSETETGSSSAVVTNIGSSSSDSSNSALILPSCWDEVSQGRGILGRARLTDEVITAREALLSRCMSQLLAANPAPWSAPLYKLVHNFLNTPSTLTCIPQQQHPTSSTGTPNLPPHHPKLAANQAHVVVDSVTLPNCAPIVPLSHSTAEGAVVQPGDADLADVIDTAWSTQSCVAAAGHDQPASLSCDAAIIINNNTAPVPSRGISMRLTLDTHPDTSRSDADLLQMYGHTCAGCGCSFGTAGKPDASGGGGAPGQTSVGRSMSLKGLGLVLAGEAAPYRRCWYTHRLYCSSCHNGQLQFIPAAVVQSWDCTARPVCNAAHDYLTSIKDLPLLCVPATNPQLYNRVPVLNQCCKVRRQICDHLDTAGKTTGLLSTKAQELKEAAGVRRYLLDSRLSDWWALSDLLDLSLGPLARMPAWLDKMAKKAAALAAATRKTS